MVINGKERGWYLSAGAAAELADMCPNGDLDKIGEVLSGENQAKALRTSAQFLCILNKWDELRKSPDATDYLRKNEVLALPIDQFQAAITEATEAFNSDRKTSIDVEAKKNSEADGNR